MFKGNSKPQEKNLGLYKAPYRRNQLSNFEKKKTVFGIISLQENVTHIYIYICIEITKNLIYAYMQILNQPNDELSSHI